MERIRLQNLHYGLYFNRFEENAIIYTTGYENATTDATVHGFEIEAEAKPFENVLFTANYTFTELKEGSRLRLPKHKANASLGYNFSEVTFASLNYQFVSGRMDTDFASFQAVELDAFSLVDFYFSQKLINNKLKLFASVTNIFNEDYVEVFDFTTKGRNVHLGLNISL